MIDFFPFLKGAKSLFFPSEKRRSRKFWWNLAPQSKIWVKIGGACEIFGQNWGCKRKCWPKLALQAKIWVKIGANGENFGQNRRRRQKFWSKLVSQAKILLKISTAGKYFKEKSKYIMSSLYKLTFQAWILFAQRGYPLSIFCFGQKHAMARHGKHDVSAGYVVKSNFCNNLLNFVVLK